MLCDVPADRLDEFIDMIESKCPVKVDYNLISIKSTDLSKKSFERYTNSTFKKYPDSYGNKSNYSSAAFGQLHQLFQSVILIFEILLQIDDLDHMM